MSDIRDLKNMVGALVTVQGKAAAANAGGLTIDTQAFRDLAVSWASKKYAVTKSGHVEAWESLVAYINAKLLQSATSAADAKDAAQWTKTSPTEQADYWNWDGDPDHAPMIYHVMWSGTAKKCFVSMGQYDINEAIWCDNFGGWWLKIEQPSIPSDRAAIAASQKGEEE